MKKGIVFISGASRGIGKNIANYFAEKDYMVVGTSRNTFKFKNKSKFVLNHFRKIIYYQIFS